jgi:hypothetical protein
MRTWRTQVHFLSDVLADGMLLAEVPGWDKYDVVRIWWRDLPAEMRSVVREGYRCHAHVNLEASRGEWLVFSNWEVS